MENLSQGDSKVFSVRIVSIDYYMAPPITNLDISYSNFHGASVEEVPVIRIFGSTPSGQKACVHVHRALPYLYVPCSDIPLQLTQESNIYENAVSLALEKALKLKGNAGSKRQHVHSCSLVRARKFYGYHSDEELFVKIYLYYPHDISRAATLLLSGAVFEKSLQPYESHIPFLLQFLADYNLYGMGYMHLVKMKFRHPIPNDLVEEANPLREESFVCESDSQADASCSQSVLFWRSSTIPDEWKWQAPSTNDPSSDADNIVKRQSSCELEGDTIVEDILNQQLKTYTSLSQTRSDVRMVQSLVPIWKEEFERSGVHEAETLTDPYRPPPENILQTFSDGINYMDQLKELYSVEHVNSKVSSECLREEDDLVVPINQDLEDKDDVCNMLSSHSNLDKDVSASLREKGVDMKVSDREDVALLKWLASSQAEEDINSDEELRQETILNPLIPSSTIDKVLEKANTDYENESQQDCQDILDSIVDVLISYEKNVNTTSFGEDFLDAKIPQLDGSGDDQRSTPTPNSPEKLGIEMVSSNYNTNSTCGKLSFDLNKNQKRQKSLWGSLPFSEVQQTSGDAHNDPRTLVSCSVRDLMRKKRCFRVESSKSGKSEARGYVKETSDFLPRKLDFLIESSKEGNSKILDTQMDEHIEKCEFRNDLNISEHLMTSMTSESIKGSDSQADPQYDEGFEKHYASNSEEKVFELGVVEEKEPRGYISMTYHKKPPLANWKNGIDEIEGRLPVQSCSFKDDNDDEETSVKSVCLEDVHPFFPDFDKDGSEKSHTFMGVPTHYQNDGSHSYLLTPALPPPSINSILEWLELQGKEPESNLLKEEEHRSEIIKGDHMTDGLVPGPDKRVPLNEKKPRKVSQDISQISGPSGQSNPTPLSQIGFRDPASVGAGQQLTLLSIEVLAESRGDLRPDPQYDTINVIVMLVQNDSSPSCDIHVLMHGTTDNRRRNLDGISGCKMFICSEEREMLDKFINITCSNDPDILIGWDIQGNSLGYLAERASHLGINLIDKISRIPGKKKTVEKNLDSSDKKNSKSISSDSLMSNSIHDNDNTIIEDEWGRTHASGVHVTGRIILNLWRLVRSEVKLNMYSLEAVSEAVLRRKVPSIHWKILNKWFLSGPGKARFRCIDFLVERAKLNIDIINQLDMINRTSELARVFGIDFFSVLSRGSQYRVESMLVRLAHTQNYVLISPGYQQVASQPAMECLPLVMEPESGFYSDPVIVLDFQALYPSMMIAYNLCFSTCLGNVVPSKKDILGVSSYSPDSNILRDLNREILVTPNGVMYVPSKVRKGVLPRLLDEILATRVMVKQAMKTLAPSQQILQRIFNSRQLALKLIANVTYGYTAAGFSGRMPCAELADSIVQCGRRTLENAISFVNTHDQWKARVIYGDTDSMFVLLEGRTMKEAFEIGNKIASTITAMNPNPVKLKMEKVYKSCFLLTKKRYVGDSYEKPNQVEPIFDAKGIETIRRDTCPVVAKTMEKSLRMFFEYQDISKVKAYLQRQWSRIISGRVSIQDFVFAKEVRLGTYSTKSSTSLPPAAIVASKAMRLDPRAEPRYAERVLYVVVHGEPSARLVDLVVDPQELLSLDSPYRLNDLYYIRKQIIPALQRVFGLLGFDLSQWFQEMPRPIRDGPTRRHFSGANSVRARIDYYYSSKHCVLCGEFVQASSCLCEECSKKGSVVAATLTGRTAKLERDIQHLVAICRHCGGGDWLVESGVKCTSLACSVYYERRKVQKELQAFSTISTQTGFYPTCMVEWF